MENEQLRITLIPAPDDWPLHSPEYQKQIRQIQESLESEGLQPSTRIELIEAVAGNAPTIFLGDFGIALMAALPVLTVIATSLGRWFVAKSRRKVRLKVGDVVAEAKSVEEIEQLLQLVAKSEKQVPKKAAKKKSGGKSPRCESGHERTHRYRASV